LFLAAVGTNSVFGLTPGEIIWYQHHARGHQYEKHLNTDQSVLEFFVAITTKRKEDDWEIYSSVCYGYVDRSS